MQICGKPDACPSGSKWLNVAPVRVILEELYSPKDLVKYPSIYLMPQDYLYDDGKTIVLAVDSLKTLTAKEPNMANLFTAKCGTQKGETNP